ncbi:MAG: hypothetical protein ACKO63_06765 [Nodosilinea sp.]|jgi:hypothetical protein
MARYTALLTLPTHHPDLSDRIARTLEGCGLVMVYSASDYMMAKEKTDQVSLSQLATVEVLINSDDQLQLVVKNEQLPLRVDNHCKATFEIVSDALLEGVSGGSTLSFR